jgi:hypothetical protein
MGPKKNKGFAENGRTFVSGFSKTKASATEGIRERP